MKLKLNAAPKLKKYLLRCAAAMLVFVMLFTASASADMKVLTFDEAVEKVKDASKEKYHFQVHIQSDKATAGSVYVQLHFQNMNSPAVRVDLANQDCVGGDAGGMLFKAIVTMNRTDCGSPTGVSVINWMDQDFSFKVVNVISVESGLRLPCRRFYSKVTTANLGNSMQTKMFSSVKVAKNSTKTLTDYEDSNVARLQVILGSKNTNVKNAGLVMYYKTQSGLYDMISVDVGNYAAQTNGGSRTLFATTELDMYGMELRTESINLFVYDFDRVSRIILSGPDTGEWLLCKLAITVKEFKLAEHSGILSIIDEYADPDSDTGNDIKWYNMYYIMSREFYNTALRLDSTEDDRYSYNYDMYAEEDYELYKNNLYPRSTTFYPMSLESGTTTPSYTDSSESTTPRGETALVDFYVVPAEGVNYKDSITLTYKWNNGYSEFALTGSTRLPLNSAIDACGRKILVSKKNKIINLSELMSAELAYAGDDTPGVSCVIARIYTEDGIYKETLYADFSGMYFTNILEGKFSSEMPKGGINNIKIALTPTADLDLSTIDASVTLTAYDIFDGLEDYTVVQSLVALGYKKLEKGKEYEFTAPSGLFEKLSSMTFTFTDSAPDIEFEIKVLCFTENEIYEEHYGSFEHIGAYGRDNYISIMLRDSDSALTKQYEY